MATAYKSDAARKNYVARPTRDGEFSVVASITLPIGTALAVNDTFEFFDIGANVEPIEFVLDNDDFDDGTDVVYTLGYTGDTDDTDAFVATGSGTHLRAADTTVISPDTLAGVAFNVIPYAVSATTTRTILLTVTTAPVTQTTVDNAARKITLLMKAQRVPGYSVPSAVYTPPTP
jgi:hypothetical protein